MDPLDRDPLERDLRDLMTDDRLALPTHLVRVDAVHAGATRRRRRRAAVTAVAGAVVVVAVAGSAFLAHQPRTSTGGPATSTSASGGTGHQTDDATLPNGPTPTPTPTGPAWDGARVMSMTATSTRTIVVLGSAGASGCTGCLRLAESHDGGATFSSLPLPADRVAGTLELGSSDGNVVSDVRFGSADDGWLFGGNLHATHDGGHSWHYVELPANVRALEAASGRVWALVAANETGGDLANDQLWSSPVGTDDWQPVPGRVVVTAPGALAVQGTRVTVLGADRSPAWSNASGTFAKGANPCRGSLDTRLSGSDTLWATCVTGTAAYLAASDDGGRTWTDVPTDAGQGSLPNSVVVGARSTGEAVLGVPQQPLARLALNGSLTEVAKPPTGDLMSYLGFTDRNVGYAIVGSDLWRTDDGAETWHRLAIVTP